MAELPGLQGIVQPGRPAAGECLPQEHGAPRGAAQVVSFGFIGLQQPWQPLKVATKDARPKVSPSKSGKQSKDNN
jgi:hypothetical protein